MTTGCAGFEDVGVSRDNSTERREKEKQYKLKRRTRRVGCVAEEKDSRCEK